MLVLMFATPEWLLIFALRPANLPAVSHLDVTAEQCAAAAEILVEVAAA